MNSCEEGFLWSSITPLSAENKSSIPDVPGVYRVYMVDGQMNPLPILRRNGKWDNDGIMYIGGTPISGTLKKRFYMHFRAHRDGMNGKIEPNGEEQDLVELWRCIRAVYPSAGLAFQYCKQTSNLDAKIAENNLHDKYEDAYGERGESGEVSLLHNPDHPWRRHLYELQSKGV